MFFFHSSLSWRLCFGADRALRGDRLPAAHQADLAIDVHRQRDRPPQRDLVRLVAADHRVLHREVRHRDVRARIAHHRDAALGQVWRQLVVREGDVGELGRHVFGDILLLVEER
jgi:hypothetical protein